MCTYENCKRSFTTPHSLKSHLKTHKRSANNDEMVRAATVKDSARYQIHMLYHAVLLQKQEGNLDDSGNQRNSDLLKSKIDVDETTSKNTKVPSYAIIPLSCNSTQSNESITFLATESANDQSPSANMLDILSRNRLNEELDYNINTKTVEDSSKTPEVTLLTSESVILNDFNKRAINNFNNNEGYDKFKIFNETDDSALQQERNQRYPCDSSTETRDNLSNNVKKSKSINLEQKIIQDGLQNTIAHISEGTDFTRSAQQYEDRASIAEKTYGNGSNVEAAVNNSNATLYNTDTVTSHVSNIISSSSETSLPLFDSGIENLSFINDTLRTGSLNEVEQSLDSSVATTQSEAIELAIASEEEIPSPWIDVMALATPSALRRLSWSELNAFPAAVHSLVDLVEPEPYPLQIENQLQPLERLDNVNLVDVEGITTSLETTHCQGNVDDRQREDSGEIKKGRNVLQEITAEADICKCIDCKCDDLQNCQNCTSSATTEVNKKDAPPPKVVDNFVSCLQSECLCDDESGGCGSCCVVICLKTLQQLQKVFSRNCCKSTSNVSCCREKLLPSLMKCQLTRNQ